MLLLWMVSLSRAHITTKLALGTTIVIWGTFVAGTVITESTWFAGAASLPDAAATEAAATLPIGYIILICALLATCVSLGLQVWWCAKPEEPK